MKINTVQTTPTQQKPCFSARNIHPIDVKYKEALREGLKDTFGIKCSVDDLRSIAGPMELKEIIGRLKPENYVPKENYRANFHVHTSKYGNGMTVDDYLYQCKSWADDVAKRKQSGDVLPPFSASITEHNEIDDVKDAVAKISQDPEKYENFKFVPGCEFMMIGYEGRYPAFEAVGLGFNPFDKNLDPLMQGVGTFVPVKDVPKITESGGILSLAHPIRYHEKLDEHFFGFLNANGIHGVEAYNLYRKIQPSVLKPHQPKVLELAKKFGMFLTGGTDGHGKTIF